jgi:putative proteasome-type protease
VPPPVTYCVAIATEQGLILASDSRTNAGPDQLSTYSKLHVLLEGDGRFLVLLCAGNLGTTQAVRARIRRDLEYGEEPNLKTVRSMGEAAEYIGTINVDVSRRHTEGPDAESAMSATFILGGQIKGRESGIFLIYPEGNYIRSSRLTRYLQVGELKYGKPILDRLVGSELRLDDAARIALLSMDAAMRSNVTVGPPIEMIAYETDTFRRKWHRVFGEDDTYTRELRRTWQKNLEQAFRNLPELPKPAAMPRLHDE